jgi:hypothetical protein
MNAKEPDELLFRELPRACDMEPFSAVETDGERAKVFFTVLRASITELQRSYEDLLRDLQELLFRAFDQPLRAKLQPRAQAVVSYCVEPRLKAVITHIANEFMDDSLWIEAIATTIVGKAPKSWNDDDRVRFEIGLAEMSRNIRHLEELLYEERKRLDLGKRPEEIFRLGVSDRNSMEVGAVVVVEQHEQKQFMSAVLELQFQLQALNVSPQIALAALASVSQSLLGEYTGSSVKEREVVKHG